MSGWPMKMLRKQLGDGVSVIKSWFPVVRGNLATIIGRFPAREKCKEGNLRFFYENFGYTAYDFVIQLDADHVPEPDYLLHMVRPFADPAVGYVAAPSICDSNLGESWTVRARLYLEASMHGVLQAGYNAGWSPNPIGSHYAVRVEAVKTLVHRTKDLLVMGGLGPELAEDHTTGEAMNAQGWRGAFALNAFAHGEGAGSINDSITQEFQWSRSLMNVLLKWTPGYWRGLSFKLKRQYLFSEFWYPIFAFHMLLCYLLPVIALVTKNALVNVSYPEFMLMSSVLTLACLLPVSWLQRQGWFRPQKCPDCKLGKWCCSSLCAGSGYFMLFYKLWSAFL